MRTIEEGFIGSDFMRVVNPQVRKAFSILDEQKKEVVSPPTVEESAPLQDISQATTEPESENKTEVIKEESKEIPEASSEIIRAVWKMPKAALEIIQNSPTADLHKLRMLVFDIEDESDRNTVETKLQEAAKSGLISAQDFSRVEQLLNNAPAVATTSNPLTQSAVLARARKRLIEAQKNFRTEYRDKKDQFARMMQSLGTSRIMPPIGESAELSAARAEYKKLLAHVVQENIESPLAVVEGDRQHIFAGVYVELRWQKALAVWDRSIQNRRIQLTQALLSVTVPSIGAESAYVNDYLKSGLIVAPEHTTEVVDREEKSIEQRVRNKKETLAAKALSVFDRVTSPVSSAFVREPVINQSVQKLIDEIDYEGQHISFMHNGDHVDVIMNGQKLAEGRTTTEDIVLSYNSTLNNTPEASRFKQAFAFVGQMAHDHRQWFEAITPVVAQ